MASATHTTPAETPSRRALLTGAAAAGATAALPALAVPAPAAATGADADLLRLCAAWRQALDRSMAALDRLYETGPGEWTGADRALEEEVLGEVHGLQHRIFGTKAATMAGVRAKAGVLAYLDSAAGIPAEHEQAASLVADIIALGDAR